MPNSSKTPPRPRTLWRNLLLLALTVLPLAITFAPFNQFYFAWIALAPWLLLIARCPSKKSSFFWSWLVGIAFFASNMWWITGVTLPGMLGLVAYLGLYFPLAALFIRPTLTPGHPRPLLAILWIATVWTALEWLRGTLFTGLPWLYLGHSQTPLLALCQIADLTSVYGVTFFLLLPNAILALFLLNGRRIKPLLPSLITTASLFLLLLAYGLFRLNQSTATPGPLVMVVQPNFPQSNTGSKGATYAEIVRFHLDTTTSALEAARATNQLPDLVVWSETMMPPLNATYQQYMARNNAEYGDFLLAVRQRLSQLASTYRISLLVGASENIPRTKPDGQPGWAHRNCAQLFTPDGQLASLRYDKIHLVPFGEYMPFKQSFPPLYKFFNLFNPYDFDYDVAPGTELTVFPLATPSGNFRFVTPICFEDVDAVLLARLMYSRHAGKRADFIVNITNDGWFAGPQMAQHLQLARFRSIETRSPTARSVNTGISGFIDPAGRTHNLLPTNTTGVSTARLTLDSRIAPYTLLGDAFAYLCLAVTAITPVLRKMKNRRPKGR